MLTLDQLNALKHIANSAPTNPESAMIHMLEALIPVLPPMVGEVVVEMLDSITETNTQENF